MAEPGSDVMAARAHPTPPPGGFGLHDLLLVAHPGARRAPARGPEPVR